jgi:ATP-dependent helicase HrpA
LPDTIVLTQRPRDVVLMPCLRDRGGRVDLELAPPGPAAVALHRAGVRRLLLKALPQQVALVRQRAMADRPLVLLYHGVGDGTALVDDLLLASADDSFELEPPIRTAAAFADCLERGRARLVETADALRELLREILTAFRELRRALDGAKQERHAGLRDELSAQIAELVGPQMLTATPRAWRQQLPRYLAAAAHRWHKRGQPREAELAAEVRTAAGRLERWRATQPEGWPWPEAIVEYRWLLEELRVSLFAQQLGTVRPVSAKRLERLWHVAQA